MRLNGVRRGLRALTIWHPYGRAFSNPRWWRCLLRAAILRHPFPPEQLTPKPATLIVTCDLELDPPWGQNSWDQRGLRGITEGLPRFLDLLDAHGIRGTFFVEGVLARLAPDAVLEVARRGHEVGCHGLAHESYGGPHRIDETIPHPRILEGRTVKAAALRQAKELLEDLIGVRVISFRAPFLHIDSTGSAAAADAGFLIDSSLENRLFGFPSIPLHLDPGDPLAPSSTEGQPPHRLIEVPVSVDPRPRLRSHHPYALVGQGPQTRSVLERIIMMASMFAGAAPALVFLVHPWEFIEGFPSPFGQPRGAARLEGFGQLIEGASQAAPVRSTAMGTFASEWEQGRCPWHANREPAELSTQPHNIAVDGSEDCEQAP